MGERPRSDLAGSGQTLFLARGCCRKMTGRLPRGRSWPMLAKRFSRQIGLAPWPTDYEPVMDSR
ncbi:hypothetical protein C4K26_2739 [Pseudomonas chlororaphis]|nr:hypothetical protein C4K26_2739 [Pseudomonas chlororaphis]